MVVAANPNSPMHQAMETQDQFDCETLRSATFLATRVVADPNISRRWGLEQ